MESAEKPNATWREEEQRRIFCRMRVEGVQRARLRERRADKETNAGVQPEAAVFPPLATSIVPSTSHSFILKPGGRFKTRCGVSVFPTGLRLHLKTSKDTETIDISYWSIHSLVFCPSRPANGMKPLLFFSLWQSLSQTRKTSQFRLILDGEEAFSHDQLDSLLKIISSTAKDFVVREPTKIILTDLQPTLGIQDLQDIVSRYGKVLGMELHLSNKTSRAAVVEFVDADSANRALSTLDKLRVDNRKIRAELVPPCDLDRGIWALCPLVETLNYDCSFPCSYGKVNVDLYFSDVSICHFWEKQPIFIHLRQIEIVYFERLQSSAGARSVDAVFVHRDFWNQTDEMSEKRLLQYTTRLAGIPLQCVEKLKDWLTERGIKYYSGSGVLRWGYALKAILQSADTFWDDTAWAFLSAKDEPGPDDEGEEDRFLEDVEFDPSDPTWEPSMAPPEGVEFSDDASLSEDDDEEFP